MTKDADQCWFSAVIVLVVLASAAAAPIAVAGIISDGLGVPTTYFSDFQYFGDNPLPQLRGGGLQACAEQGGRPVLTFDSLDAFRMASLQSAYTGDPNSQLSFTRYHLQIRDVAPQRLVRANLALFGQRGLLKAVDRWRLRASTFGKVLALLQ